MGLSYRNRQVSGWCHVTGLDLKTRICLHLFNNFKLSFYFTVMCRKLFFEQILSLNIRAFDKKNKSYSSTLDSDTTRPVMSTGDIAVLFIWSFGRSKWLKMYLASSQVKPSQSRHGHSIENCTLSMQGSTHLLPQVHVSENPAKPC